MINIIITVIATSLLTNAILGLAIYCWYLRDKKEQERIEEEMIALYKKISLSKEEIH